MAMPRGKWHADLLSVGSMSNLRVARSTVLVVTGQQYHSDLLPNAPPLDSWEHRRSAQFRPVSLRFTRSILASINAKTIVQSSENSIALRTISKGKVNEKNAGGNAAASAVKAGSHNTGNGAHSKRSLSTSHDIADTERAVQTSHDCGNSAHANARTAILWFKHDLRMDDHPGLAAACAYSQILPLFVFDFALMTGWSPELVEALIDAIADLRRSLQRLGSDLVIRSGRTKDILMALVREVGAVDIITEEEVEMELQDLLGLVSASFSVEAISTQATAVKQWRNFLHDVQARIIWLIKTEFGKTPLSTRAVLQEIITNAM